MLAAPPASSPSGRHQGLGRWLPLALLLLAGACAPQEHYLRSRWNDTVQVTALDVGLGGGLHASVQATRFLGLGFGLALSIRGGIQPPPTWRNELFTPPGEGDLPWRGPGFWAQFDAGLPGFISFSRDVHNPHGFFGPTEGNAFLLVPVSDGDDDGFWPTHPDLGPPGSWLDLHARGFLVLVGGHVGFSPLEFVDWLAGWLLLDPLQDDIPDDWAPDEPADDETQGPGEPTAAVSLAEAD